MCEHAAQEDAAQEEAAQKDSPHKGAVRDPVWIRHSDFYPSEGELPGRPGPRPGAQEVRRQHWGPVRRAPSDLLALVLKGYRKIVSPLYGQVCSFYPSCSAYGLESVTVHGVIKGSVLTAWRILRCNPFTGGGVDPVPPGRRIWPQGAVPTIIETNHPPIPGDTEQNVP